ncbi:MAG: metalloregulator ArsR/SmtB family transcription factor [Chloroflexota bacterium]
MRLPVKSYQHLGALTKALANPVRLQILHVLAQQEACVCHLTTVLGKRQANVSQHLIVLRDAKLVEDRRDGMMVYYRLASGRVAKVLTLLQELALDMGVAVELPDVPISPVPGCPCPICSGAGAHNGPSAEVAAG